MDSLGWEILVRNIDSAGRKRSKYLTSKLQWTDLKRISSKMIEMLVKCGDRINTQFQTCRRTDSEMKTKTKWCIMMKKKPWIAATKLHYKMRTAWKWDRRRLSCFGATLNLILCTPFSVVSSTPDNTWKSQKSGCYLL